MNRIDIRIEHAAKAQAPQIASLIMEAMDHDCCRHFAGPNHNLDEFKDMMTSLVLMDNSQYSYLNTLVAMVGDEVAGCIVAYDGKDLHRLRRRFIDETLTRFGRDFSGIDDETKAGEYYIDSLCVNIKFRKRGIATMLIKEIIRRHCDQPVALLVDYTHPWAERLYKSIGFKVVEETTWGGHAMRRMHYLPDSL